MCCSAIREFGQNLYDIYGNSRSNNNFVFGQKHWELITLMEFRNVFALSVSLSL